MDGACAFIIVWLTFANCPSRSKTQFGELRYNLCSKGNSVLAGQNGVTRTLFPLQVEWPLGNMTDNGGNTYRRTLGQSWARVPWPRGLDLPARENEWGQWVNSLEANRTNSTFPKWSQMPCTTSGWSHHSTDRSFWCDKNNNNMLLPASPLIFLGGRPEGPKVYYHLLQKMYLCSAVQTTISEQLRLAKPQRSRLPLML